MRFFGMVIILLIVIGLAALREYRPVENKSVSQLKDACINICVVAPRDKPSFYAGEGIFAVCYCGEKR